jgi:hypothetical protein
LGNFFESEVLFVIKDNDNLFRGRRAAEDNKFEGSLYDLDHHGGWENRIGYDKVSGESQRISQREFKFIRGGERETCTL